MAKTIIVCGYGTGISKAVAEKFGAEGFSVALVSRNADKVTAGVKELEAKKIKAAAFPTDLGDAKAVEQMVAKVHATLGPIDVLHWNAYSGHAGDALEADTATLHHVFDVAVTGLLAAIRAAHADLKAQKGAVLVTNGGFGLSDPNVDAICVKVNAMGLSVANAAKHKLVGMLHQKLKADDIYVGELMVMSTIKGTSFDQGNSTLEATTVAAKFWELAAARKDISVPLS